MKKTNFLISGVLLVCLFLTSCSDDDTSNEVNIAKTNSKTIKFTTQATGAQDNPSQQDGVFTKINFSEGKVVDNTSDNWDLAFRGRLILVNGINGEDKTKTIGFKNEPLRKKNVAVATILANYDNLKSVEDITDREYMQDLTYAQGSYDLTTAINYASNTRDNQGSRQAWHVRSHQDINTFLLTPVVFVLKTQDGHYVKMKIESINRTNKDFDKKEDIEYKIKYFYNPKEGNPNVDHTK